MSFSADVKNEILSVEIENDCCKHAFAYGMMLFSRAFSSYDMSILTEHSGIAQTYFELMKSVCGVTAKLIKSKSGKIKVEITKESERIKVLETFGYSKKNGAVRLNWANFSDECCKNAFLKGVFLACGTVNDPNKRYHLEFVVPYLNLSRDLKVFINDFEQLSPLR